MEANDERQRLERQLLERLLIALALGALELLLTLEPLGLRESGSSRSSVSARHEKPLIGSSSNSSKYLSRHSSNEVPPGSSSSMAFASAEPSAGFRLGILGTSSEISKNGSFAVLVWPHYRACEKDESASNPRCQCIAQLYLGACDIRAHHAREAPMYNTRAVLRRSATMRVDAVQSRDQELVCILSINHRAIHSFTQLSID